MIKVEKEGDDMLVNVLLIAVILAAGIYGYYLVSRLDDWAAGEKDQNLKEEEAQSGEACAVLFGSGRQIHQLEGWVENYGLVPIVIDEVSLQREWKNIRLVIAASPSDEDNLSICHLIQRMYHTKQAYGICNDQINYIMYKRFHIHVLDEKTEITQQLELMFRRNEAGIA